MRNRLSILVVIVAILTSQVAVSSHRVEHFAEEQAARENSGCHHRETADHFCDHPAIASHAADCVLCAAASSRLDVPRTAVASVAPILVLTPLVVWCSPFIEPLVILPAPRGPPA